MNKLLQDDPFGFHLMLASGCGAGGEVLIGGTCAHSSKIPCLDSGTISWTSLKGSPGFVPTCPTEHQQVLKHTELHHDNMVYLVMAETGVAAASWFGIHRRRQFTAKLMGSLADICP